MKKIIIYTLIGLLLMSSLVSAWFPENTLRVKKETEEWREFRQNSCVQEFSFFHTQEQLYFDELIRSGNLWNKR